MRSHQRHNHPYTNHARAERVRQSGFTLIELMVVVLIMGLGLGLVALSVGRDGSTMARDEAEQFMLRADFVAEQVVLNSEVIGLFVEPRDVINSSDYQWCYRWQRLRNNSWEELSDALEERCLPSALQVEMVVENEPYEYDPEVDTPTPVVVFYPSGESTVFELAIYDADQRLTGTQDAIQRIEIDMMGTLRWVNREAELAAAQAAQ